MVRPTRRELKKVNSMDTDLRVYAQGEAFAEGVYDLRSLEILVSSYRAIMDRLVAVQLGRRQLPDKAKKGLDYNVQVKDGSIELLIDFTLQHPELFGAISQDGGHQISNAITRLFRSAIDLRKAAARFIENGVEFNINISNSFNFSSNNVHANDNTGEITISDSKVLWSAQATRYPTDRILRRIDGTRIEYVDLATRDEEFRLSKNHRDILGRAKEELNVEVNVVGRLDMIAFSSHRGKIVSSNESFPVKWDDPLRSKMQSVADIDGVTFRVRPIVDNSRLHRDAIAFHVLDCELPRQENIPGMDS